MAFFPVCLFFLSLQLQHLSEQLLSFFFFNLASGKRGAGKSCLHHLKILKCKKIKKNHKIQNMSKMLPVNKAKQTTYKS